MNFQSISDPVYADLDKRSILCNVTLPNNQVVPYMAVDGDEASQGLYNDLVAGKYGQVAAFTVLAASSDELRTYANQKEMGLASLERSYSLDGGLAIMCDASQETLSNLQGLSLWGTGNPSSTTRWVDDNGNVTPLTGAQCVSLSGLVVAYWQSLFPVLAQAMTGITDGSITTTAQIDSLPWPT